MSRSDKTTDPAVPRGGRLDSSKSHLSLSNVHGSVEVPHHEASFWEQWRAFVGPAILVSVGYMDPGNWGTDLQGGAQFKYGLALGGRARQPHGDLHAGYLRAPRASLPERISRNAAATGIRAGRAGRTG